MSSHPNGMKDNPDEGNPNKKLNTTNTPPPGWTVQPAPNYYIPPPTHPVVPPAPFPPYFYPPPSFPPQSQVYGIPPAPARPPPIPQKLTGTLPPWLQKDFRPPPPVKINPGVRPPVATKEPIKISLTDCIF